MPAASTALTTKVESGSPYQLDSAQTLKASKALLAHIRTSEKASTTASGKQSLLKDTSDDEEEADDESTPIWLSLTTKTHIIKDKKFKPLRLTVPHALNTSPTTTICLITADPQRTYKDLIQDASFPRALAARITKVVGVSKLKKKYNQYEAQRKLYAEHDIFLADDRIITQLTKLLGKTFYKGTTKRPIPVDIAEPAPKVDGKRVSRAKPTGEGKGEGQNGGRGAASPKAVAAEIERAIKCAVVSLTPSTQTAVRVGYASWDAEKLAANIEAVALGLIEGHVPKKWRGVRSLHVKGPATIALPIWLADELWTDEKDVLGEEEARSKIQAANVGKKRKSGVLDGVEGVIAGADAEKTGQGKKSKKQKVLAAKLESNDDNLDKEIKARKEKLKKQKAEAAVDAGADEMPKASKRAKKSAA
ncbi:ribosomal protein L1p/L10e family-domain-containing protein [Rhexocercosporidium sp. MPI-PUGE-AT-0058]|nr:ribosomal protein L1p/L10e family-domain-containing protein [Rhexocercosporidium sp. MPI-PUGE-AT-0058]